MTTPTDKNPYLAREVFCEAVLREAECNGRWKRISLGKPANEAERVMSRGQASDDLVSAGRRVEETRVAMIYATLNSVKITDSCLVCGFTDTPAAWVIGHPETYVCLSCLNAGRNARCEIVYKQRSNE